MSQNLSNVLARIQISTNSKHSWGMANQRWTFLHLTSSLFKPFMTLLMKSMMKQLQNPFSKEWNAWGGVRSEFFKNWNKYHFVKGVPQSWSISREFNLPGRNSNIKLGKTSHLSNISTPFLTEVVEFFSTYLGKFLTFKLFCSLVELSCLFSPKGNYPNLFKYFIKSTNLYFSRFEAIYACWKSKIKATLLPGSQQQEGNCMATMYYAKVSNNFQVGGRLVTRLFYRTILTLTY